MKIPDLDSMTPAQQIASVGVWYHVIDLGEHGKTPGYYNMAPFLGNYRLPESLAGKAVLDVGASNGFFSFLFEQRGADRVVATELPHVRDHDVPHWLVEQELARRTPEQVEQLDWDELHGGFLVASRLLGSKVERVLSTIYQLPENITERFDIVFCSNVLVHVQNPIAAIEAMRRMLKPGGLGIFATPVARQYDEVCAAILVGEPTRCAWWVPTTSGLLKMCQAAGFAATELVSTYEVERERGEPIPDRVGVVHCRAGA